MCNETMFVEIEGKPARVDACIAGFVGALNAAGMRTIACCCGHGKRSGQIALDDGREIEIHAASADRVTQNWSMLASASDVERIVQCLSH